MGNGVLFTLRSAGPHGSRQHGSSRCVRRVGGGGSEFRVVTDSGRRAQGSVKSLYSGWISAEGGAGGPPSACGPTHAAQCAQTCAPQDSACVTTHRSTADVSPSTNRSTTRLHPLRHSADMHPAAFASHAATQVSSTPCGGAWASHAATSTKTAAMTSRRPATSERDRARSAVSRAEPASHRRARSTPRSRRDRPKDTGLLALHPAREHHRDVVRSAAVVGARDEL